MGDTRITHDFTKGKLYVNEALIGSVAQCKAPPSREITDKMIKPGLRFRRKDPIGSFLNHTLVEDAWGKLQGYNPDSNTLFWSGDGYSNKSVRAKLIDFYELAEPAHD